MSKIQCCVAGTVFVLILFASTVVARGPFDLGAGNIYNLPVTQVIIGSCTITAAGYNNGVSCNYYSIGRYS